MTKKPHIVPEFFLERFTDARGELWVYDVARQKKYESSPGDLCTKRFLYETKWKNASPKLGKFVLPEKIEKTFNKYETEFAALLRDLDYTLVPDQNSNTLICSEKNKTLLFRFIANLLFRNPVTMDMYKLSEVDMDRFGLVETKKFCDFMDKLGIGGGESILIASKKQAFLLENDENPMAEFITKLKSLPFSFFYAEEGELVLSNDPVSCGIDNYITGDNKECLYLPLSPKVAVLFGAYRGIRNNRMYKIDADGVEYLNSRYIGYNECKKDLIICSSKEQRDRVYSILNKE